MTVQPIQFCKMGNTSVSMHKAGDRYRVAAIGGRVFASASFYSRDRADAYYQDFITKVKDTL